MSAEYNFRFRIDWNVPRFDLDLTAGYIGQVKVLGYPVVGSPTQEQINIAVAEYIEEHPGSAFGISEEVKQALLQIAEKVVYIDEHGQDYYDALYAALYPPTELVSIAAVYTQSGTVYNTDSLDSLKADLVVTAYYDDGTTADVTSTCTLSGTLAEGTSTITAEYNGKTATFTVTVTAQTYVTDGLIHQWDAIDNTGSGHNGSATVWKDLIGSIDLTQQTGGTWTANALHFEPTATTDAHHWKDTTQTSIYTQTMTIEVCISPTGSALNGWEESKSAVIANFTSSANSALRRIMLSKSDISVGGYTNGTNQFATTGLTTLRDIHHIAVTYTTQTGSNTVYCNGTLKTKDAQHTFGENKRNYVFVGCSLGDSKYPYLGDVHSIRVYNKVLTAEEVAQNYAVDVIRFGLE